MGNDAQGAENHIHVDVGLSTVELPLEAILAVDHSLMVHESADDMGTSLACGAIGGHDVDGSFLVGLGPVDGSGYSGIAWLTDKGDGTTDVEVTMPRSSASAFVEMDDEMTADDDMEDDDMESDGWYPAVETQLSSSTAHRLRDRRRCFMAQS